MSDMKPWGCPTCKERADAWASKAHTCDMCEADIPHMAGECGRIDPATFTPCPTCAAHELDCLRREEILEQDWEAKRAAAVEKAREEIREEVSRLLAIKDNMGAATGEDWDVLARDHQLVMDRIFPCRLAAPDAGKGQKR